MNIVKSVEAVGFTFNSATYSQDLTKSQVAENCVPFKSTYASSGLSGYSYGVFTDATVTGTTPTFYSERSNYSTCYPQFYIVEFEPTEVNVQSGSFEFTGTTHTATVSGIDVDKSMLVVHYKTTYGNRYLAYMAVQSKFGATVSGITDIEFQRGGASGSIIGHWYVIEDLNDNFTVSHHTASTASSSTVPEITERYDLNNTMFLSTYYNTVTGDPNPQHNCVLQHVRDDILIRFYRNSTSNEFYAAYQIVRFNVGTNKRMVFRRYASMANGIGSEDWDIDDGYSQLYSVDLDYSMVYTPMLNQTGYAYTGDSSAYERQYFGASFVDANTVRIQRGESNDGNLYSIEVVDWSASITMSGTTPAPKDPNLDAIDSMVKSIEQVDFTATHYWDEHLLTKGQDVSNCVPFLTYDCSGAAGTYQFQDVYFLEPSTLRMANPDGSTRRVKGSVIEFEPDQVRVQQGTFFTSDQSATVTISGVDLDKAALKFYYQVTDGSYPHDDHFVRGRFTTASGLEFYRYGTSGAIKGTYYVFEALDDQFSVQSGLSSTGGSSVSTTMTADAYRHNSFMIYSYYYSGTDQNPQHTRTRGRQYTRREFYVDRQSTSNEIYNAWFVIAMKGVPNKVFCQVDDKTMENAVVTDTLSLLEDVNPETSMVFHSVNTSSARTTEGNSSYSNRTMFNLELTSSGVVTINRYTSANVCYLPITVVDFAGITTYSGVPQSVSDDSLLTSFEYFDFEHTHELHHIAPTKGQNLDNCVPFSNSHARSYLGGYPYAHRPEIYFSEGIIHMKAATGWDTRDVNMYLVEFNPNRVKVQSGHFTMPSTSTTVTIDEVDLDKTFLVLNWQTNTGSQSWCYHLVRGKFNSSTELLFERGAASGLTLGTWYVVESLDSGFTVESGDSSSASDCYAYTTAHLSSRLDKSMALVSIRKDSNTDTNPQHSAYRGYMTWSSSQYLTYAEKQSSSTTGYATFFVVNFAEEEGVRVQHRDSVPLAGSDYTITYDIEQVDTERAMVISPLAFSTARCDDGSSAKNDKCFQLHTLTNSGTQVYTIATNTSATATYGAYEVVEWPAPQTLKIDGYVKELGSPVVRTVNMYDRSTGELVSTTTSRASDGYYQLPTSVSGEHFVVAFDDAAGEVYNALIADRLMPEEI